VAGGGVTYSRANDALRGFAESTGVPVGETQAGKGALPYDHPQAVGAIGATGSTAANALANDADLVIGVGTRYSDFTTASHTLFAADGVRFVNVNVSTPDAVKLSGLSVTADARESLVALRQGLSGWKVDESYTHRVHALSSDWDSTVTAAYAGPSEGDLPAQSQIIGVVNEVSGPADVVVCAAGSMPGDLHKLWRTRDPKGYHVEYGYSCMGYEIAGGLGVRLAAPERDVFVMVGDGSYLMMAQELVTAVAERVKLIVVLVDNRGFASIGALSESVGAQRFGTRYRYRDPEADQLTGPDLPVDLAANAASLGVDVLRTSTVEEFVRTDPLRSAPDSAAWWDVPVAEVSTLDSTANARKEYETHRRDRRNYLGQG
jgi:3D-(3,5/4)-trihydroxycyclohexane-1,2-dione acylhydrolase (decyclizing)